MANKLKSLLTTGNLLRIGAAIGLTIVAYLIIDTWVIGGKTSLFVDWLPYFGADHPVTLLSPQWLFLCCVIPTFYLLRMVSLTDLSLTQQVFQATLRSLVVAGVAIALARPSWITEQSKVSTVVLVDVSDSVSEKQLDAAKKYVDELQEGAGDDGNFQLITFAEKPQVIRSDDGKLSAAIKRHVGAGAGTDTQAAMQLAYGL